jgi:hypothetical protein
LAFDTVTTNPLTLTGSTNNTIPTVTAANALTGEANFTYDGNTLDIKNAGTASSIKVYCETSNLHYTEIKSGPHSGATSYTITLPNAPPSVSGQVLSATTAGVASWATAESGLNSRQVYTSSTTWSKPTGITKIIVEGQGAGGSGGGGGPSKGAGGGGGGYAKKFLDVTNIDTATVTVGVGGLNPTTNSTGNPGTASEFIKATGSGSFTTISCGGGAGGVYNYGAGGLGGTVSGGDLEIAGGSGGGNSNENNHGGGSFFTPSHYSVTGGLNPSGPASGYGGGGEGSRVTGGGAGSKGGDGMNGIIIVWEYK